MIVITLARKPLSVTPVAASVLVGGVGALNIGACRVAFVSMDDQHRALPGSMPGASASIGTFQTRDRTLEDPKAFQNQAGRWPANLILQHLPGCQPQGSKRVRSNQSRSVGAGKGHGDTPGHGIYHGVGGVVQASTADADGMETVESWVCEPGCPVAVLDGRSGILKSGGKPGALYERADTGSTYGVNKTWGAAPSLSDVGGASRFFKQVKP